MYSKLIKKTASLILVIALAMSNGVMAFADDNTFDQQNSNAAPLGDTSVSSITTDSVLKGDVPVVYGYDIKVTKKADTYSKPWKKRDIVKVPMSESLEYSQKVSVEVSGSRTATTGQIENSLGFSFGYEYSWKKTIDSNTDVLASLSPSLNGKRVQIKSRTIYATYSVSQQHYSSSRGVKTKIGNPSLLTVKRPYATEWSYDVLPD